MNLLSQCVKSSTLGGGTFVNDNTISGSDFSPLGNAGADDDNEAKATAPITLLSSAKTKYLKATNFGFSIPASATICGVSVRIKKKATGIDILTWVTDESVRLVVGGTVTGNNAASGAHWTETSAFSTYGGPSNTWGATLTPAQVNSSTFGIAIAAEYRGVIGLFLKAEIDYITIQVSYMNTVVPLILGDYTTHISDSRVHNRWTMHEEEDNAKINLQKSADGKTWQNIETVFTTNNIGTKTYEVIDQLAQNGNYYYRLELRHASGNITYSKINAVRYEKEVNVKIYPNPASVFITISNIPAKSMIQLFTSTGEQLKPPSFYTSGTAQLDIRSLKKGVYFIVVGDKKFNIVKH